MTKSTKPKKTSAPKNEEEIIDPAAPAEVAPEVDEAEADADELDVEEDDGSDEVTIAYQNPTIGPTTRVFTRALHGDQFRELAKLFMKKFEGSVVK